MNKNITFYDLHQAWKSQVWDSLKRGSQLSFQSSMKQCEPLHNLVYAQLTREEMQTLLDELQVSPSSKGSIKNLLRKLNVFAIKQGIVEENVAQYLTTEVNIPKEKKLFSYQEIDRLASLEGVFWAETVLVQLYTGMSGKELVEIKKSDVDLENTTLTIPAQSVDTITRTIPIHSKILPIIQRYMQTDKQPELFTYDRKKISYPKYFSSFRVAMDILQMEHTILECTHTLRVKMSLSGISQEVIDYVLGEKPLPEKQEFFMKELAEKLDAIA